MRWSEDKSGGAWIYILKFFENGNFDYQQLHFPNDTDRVEYRMTCVQTLQNLHEKEVVQPSCFEWLEVTLFFNCRPRPSIRQILTTVRSRAKEARENGFSKDRVGLSTVRLQSQQHRLPPLRWRGSSIISVFLSLSYGISSEFLEESLCSKSQDFVAVDNIFNWRQRE